jgi:hypothetical protein
MAKRKPEKPYKGILATPTPKQGPRLLEEEGFLALRDLFVGKMNALFDHHGIDHNDPKKWRLIAYRLAWDHVPGFAPSEKQGRKVDRENFKADLQLFLELEYKRGGHSVKRKAEQLTNTHPLFKGKNPGTLRERYYLLKNERSPEGKRLHDACNRFNADGSKK